MVSYVGETLSDSSKGAITAPLRTSFVCTRRSCIIRWFMHTHLQMCVYKIKV
jgi:hypothetical protein